MAEELSGSSSHFDVLIGTEWLDSDPDGARVRVPLRDELLQPLGLLHGGVMSSLIESVCSLGTAAAVWDEGNAAMGQSITVNFVRPITEGSVEVRAVARHRGRTTWIWEAEVLDDQERLCATAMMTMAVRPRPEGS